MKRTGLTILLCATMAAGAITGCATTTNSATASGSSALASSAVSEFQSMGPSGSASGQSATAAVSAAANPAGGSILNTSDLFTDRDLAQTADTANAKTLTVKSGENVEITEEGVYVISGTATNCTITVNADSSAKVQLVLDNVSITNETAPAIYVASADKVFVTTASGSNNELTTTGTFAAIDDNNVDGVIYAKDDIVLNGEGTLTIKSSGNGIVGKDDVKVTGGTYKIEATGHGIQGKDSIAIANGTFDINAGTDALHSENADDQSLGYVYVADGTLNLTAASDGIEGAAVVQIDGGTLNISGVEGIEGTYVQINDGTISIDASDDGVNATSKSTEYDVAVEINGGKLTVNMAQGDTDALDSNGSLFITGGTVDITAQSAFDYDAQGALTGGTVTVNGQQVTELTNSMMGGGMGGGRGGMGGQPSGDMGSQPSAQR